MSNNLYPPKSVSMSTLKSKILRPATTSNFQCWFPAPIAVKNWIAQKKNAGIDLVYNYETIELISLNCVEASLPGSSFATLEANDDYTGVTERLAYRRQYDDRADFTFQVDNSVDLNDNQSNYRVLLFFELWMQYISDEGYGSNGFESPNYFYRMNYPDNYQAPYIIINKFEKDFKGNYLQYKFLQAYPLAINSVPVSYESSQLLQYTISFSYVRYIPKTIRHSTILPPANQQVVTGSRSTSFFPPPPTGEDLRR